MPINFEFKAGVKDISVLEEKLLKLHPVFIGEDHQIDTYFNVRQGRLKLREGSIEHALIYYERPDTTTQKQSGVLLHEPINTGTLKEILIRVHGIKAIVDKKRRIYFIDNVKFHFDIVKGIGSFIEVEAIDKTGELGMDKIREQCKYYAQFFDIKDQEYIGVSYSDLVLSRNSPDERIKLSGITAPV